MPRLPLIPTLLVAAAIATMIGLGLWQLDRREEKAQAIALYARNPALPPIAFPRPTVGEQHLFRRASATCLEVTGWRTQGAGSHGYRFLAQCRTGAEGPGLLVEAGVARDPTLKPRWRGGQVSGTVALAPDSRPMLAGLFGDRAPRTLMLIADTPAPGLAPSPRPAIGSIPNNHLAYAGQWFFFAIVAGVIYVLALRRRGTKPR